MALPLFTLEESTDFSTLETGFCLAPGAAKDYVIELEEGDYLYSCPLDPTPDDRIVVAG